MEVFAKTSFGAISYSKMAVLPCLTAIAFIFMKSRFLYVLFSFFALFSSYGGIGLQKTVFLSSDVKTVEIYSPVKQVFICSSVSDSRLNGIEERSFSETRKKTEFSSSLSDTLMSGVLTLSCRDVPPFTILSETAARVLLLPKSVKNIIFLQTVI